MLFRSYLWLPPEIGQPIAATATLVFVFMLISGLVLWWPKNKAAQKQRFSIKWSARWRRKNYDLHNVLGFYAIPVALILALTGLIMGFQWFSKSVYWTLSGGKAQVPYYEPLSAQKATPNKPVPVVDLIWEKTRVENPKAETIEIHYPASDSSAIGASTNTDSYTYWKGDHVYYDQNTLANVPVTHAYGRYSDNLSAADKLMRMNYDIHVGAIAGLPGKILAFIISLIVATLPVTGFMIWWGRRKQSKENENKSVKSRGAVVSRPKPFEVKQV